MVKLIELTTIAIVIILIPTMMALTNYKRNLLRYSRAITEKLNKIYQNDSFKGCMHFYGALKKPEIRSLFFTHETFFIMPETKSSKTDRIMEVTAIYLKVFPHRHLQLIIRNTFKLDPYYILSFADLKWGITLEDDKANLSVQEGTLKCKTLQDLLVLGECLGSLRILHRM